jgi:primosomal protein N' (replication factor Y)
VGKYAISSMKKRVDNRKLPEIKIVDMRREVSADGKLPIISKELLRAIDERLAQSEQIMLFLNRRGFATSVMCPKCGHVESCTQCDVTLTFHKNTNLLKCHTCGLVRKAPELCPKCSSPTLKFSGIGTERVEKIITELFPKARILRMDRDTTVRKDSYQKILSQFRCGKADILIGTQMIAKGHDFPGVTLVGIITADITLNVPDLRSEERTFQLLVQMAGRAGRGELSGEVIIQTFSPKNRAIKAVASMQENRFYEEELLARKELFYPPYSHFICIGIEAKQEAAAMQTAFKIKNALINKVTTNTIITGPIPPLIPRVKGYFRQQLIIKTSSILKTVPLLRDATQQFRTRGGLRIMVDIDALSSW